MGSAFELLCVVQKRAAALRKKIDKSHMGLRRQKRKAEQPIVKNIRRSGFHDGKIRRFD
ncbi:hypothetical protein D3C72_673670 [compost metagenome]